MKKVYELALPSDIEAAELAELERKTELRKMEQRVRNAELRAEFAEKRSREERERMKKEQEMLLGGISIFALMLTAITCIIAAPWWTAVAPLLLIVYVFLKMGW